MGIQVKASPTHHYSAGPNEISLLSTFAFCWHLRYFLLSGLVAGLAGFWLIYSVLAKRTAANPTHTFVAQIADLSKGGDLKKLTESYYTGVLSPKVIGVVFDALVQNSPQFATVVKSGAYSKAEFIAQQSSRKPALQVNVDSDEDIQVIVSLPLMQRGLELESQVLAALNSATIVANTASQARQKREAKRTQNEANRLLTRIENEYSEDWQSYSASLATLRLEIGKVEYSIFQEAKGVPSPELEDILRSRHPANSDNYETSQPNDPTVTLDRLLRACGALAASTKSNKQKIQSIVGELSALRVRSTLLDIRRETLQTANESASNRVAKMLNDSIFANSFDNWFALPKLEVNPNAIKSLDELPTPPKLGAGKSIVFALFCAAVGATLGLLAGNLVGFLRRNWPLALRQGRLSAG